MMLCCSVVSLQCQNSMSKEVTALFNSVTTSLTSAEKNEIFKLSDFALADNGTQFYFKGDQGSAEFPFNAYIFPLDLNLDGEEEIGLVFGNMMTSGNAGSSARLFIKNEEGSYESHLGFPGSLVFIPNDNNDFPDVVIAGPGFEFPVWSWDGETYSMSHKIKNDALGALNPTYMAQASKSYTQGLKKD